MKNAFIFQSLGALLGMATRRETYLPPVMNFDVLYKHTHRHGKAKRLKSPSKYIPAGPNRNCGWNGINPKMKARHDARKASLAAE